MMQKRPPRMTHPTVIAVGILCASLVGGGLGTVRLVARARAALMSQLAEAQLREVDEISRIVQDDIDQIASDLRFVGQLVQGAASVADRAREIGALLEASK